MAALHMDAIDPRSLLQEIPQSERFPVLSPAAGQIGEAPFIFQADEGVESSEPEGVSIRPLDPIEVDDREFKSKVQQFRDIVSAYERRIEILKEQASLDGYPLNPASKEAFLEFLKKPPFIRRGRLVLMENGNLRAVWKGENEAHIGLQFINNRSVQYVIFTRREPRFPVSRVSGRDTLDGIKR